ncbi:MAG TPA: Ig-like domain-containing protein, partial [Clostridia bacterium]|nr:Ig-like domain-containing protein [Clostridia bacterium]
DVVATAEGNIKARCRILVTSADVMGIAISDNIPMNFGVGDRHQMEAALNPADATTSQRYINWSVISGNDLVSIDQNGIITALNAGAVTVRAKLKNPPENLDAKKRYADFSFNILGNSTTEVFKTKLITMNGEGYGLQEVLNPDYDGEYTLETDKGTLSGTPTRYLSINYGGTNTVTANITAKSNGVEVDTLQIVFKQIFFLNSDIWSILDDGSEKPYLTLNSAGIYIDVKSKLSNVTLASSDESIASIDNGYLVAHSVGEATVSAFSGTIIESFVIKVLPPIYEVNLYYSNAEDDKGVAMTRTFGRKTFSNGALSNNLLFEVGSIYTVVGGENKILSAPSDIANYFYLLDFELDSSSQGNGFSITGNGLLTVGSSNNASVKLKARYPLYESIEISSTYNIKLIENGVNIGVISKAQREQWANQNKTAREIEDIINNVTLEGFDFVNAQAKAQYDATGVNDDFAIVLHSGLIMNNTEKSLYCSLYGNGNILRQTREDVEAFWDGVSTETYATLKVVVDNVTIENAIIRAARALNEGESLYDYIHGGNGIVVDGRDKYFQNGVENVERLKNININYVIVENAYYCIYAAAADVNIRGAIIRNSGAQSLYINTSVQDIGSGAEKKTMNAMVNLTNCVFSNAINMSIGIITEDLDASYDADETVMVDGQSVTRPKYVSYFENVTQSVLHIQGFCEIYNWKKSSELDFTFVSEYGIDGDWVGSIVRNLIDNDWDTLSGMLKGVDLNQFMCEVDGVKYYQLAIGNVGVHYPMSGYIPEEDKNAIGLTGVVSMDISSFSYMAKGMHIRYPLQFCCYDTKNPAVSPTDKCIVDSTLFTRMMSEV